jgi:hypothetical protein
MPEEAPVISAVPFVLVVLMLRLLGASPRRLALHPFVSNDI